MTEQASPGSAPSDEQERGLADLRAALGDDFEVVRKLGTGSVATVWLARERALGRLVAVKVLSPGRNRDETSRRRFEREARAAASLVHPNLVDVYRFGRLPDETPYLVMRFVKGRTLEERLAAEGRLPADQARTVLQNVASALAAAHAQGIVHRDVRPANILWDEEHQCAHLTDFGIAALLVTSGDEATRLTKTGQMVGDTRYLSPEQLLDRDLTELADMYAFGLLGYELFTGEGAYEAKTKTQWITAHLSAEPRDLRRLRPDIDPAIADLLRRCLNREPNHRPSAADAVRLLDPGQAGSTSPAPTRGGITEPGDMQELLRRRVPQIVLLAAGAGLGLMGLMSQLVEMEILPHIMYRLTLPFAGAGVVAATIVAWFHGERGRQQSTLVEWVLLGSVAALWIAVSAWIVLG